MSLWQKAPKTETETNFCKDPVTAQHRGLGVVYTQL